MVLCSSKTEGRQKVRIICWVGSSKYFAQIFTYNPSYMKSQFLSLLNLVQKETVITHSERI